MAYTRLQRRRIHLRAKKTLGLKLKDNDRFYFMQECIQDMTESGEASDISDARDLCELLYEEMQQDFEE